jgi:acetolactate synthase-1/3 small subunit
MMVKIQAHDTDRQSIISITEIFHGKVVDVTKDSMIIEVTGKQGKIDSFLDMLQDYKILELARTGLTGLTRGSEDVYHVG